jgi:hypothetical protein
LVAELSQPDQVRAVAQVAAAVAVDEDLMVAVLLGVDEQRVALSGGWRSVLPPHR